MPESTSQPPHFAAEAARHIARDLFDIEGQARSLPSERDQNFHIQPKNKAEPSYVLKIANAAETKGVLDFQNQVLIHLNQADSSLACPQVCLSQSGQAIMAVQDDRGIDYFVRLLTYLPGVPLAKVNPHTPELLRQVGTFLGQIDQALIDFSHPAMRQELKWDLRKAAKIITQNLPLITDARRRTLLETFLTRFEKEVVPALPELRTSVIHHDGNDYNILIDNTTPFELRMAGLIDYGDMLHTCTVFEPAIAAAYAMLDKADPIAAVASLIGGYHIVFPLTEQEIALLYPLICARLCQSVTISAQQQALEPDNKYLKISEQPAWTMLEKLSDVHPRLAHYRFREACQLPPCPQSKSVANWLQNNAEQIGPIVEPELESAAVFDLNVGSPMLAQAGPELDTAALTRLLFAQMAQLQAPVGIGRYNEARQVYQSEAFKATAGEYQEWRTIHLGIDLFLEAGAPVFAPLEGTVHSFHNNVAPFDYGPTIILTHTIEQSRTTFYTLYGHLDAQSLNGLAEGMPVERGQQIGRIGTYPDNGNWPPHLHFQIITDILDRAGEFPGVAPASQRAVWLSLSPDPNLILGIPAAKIGQSERDKQQILTTRRQKLGKSLSVSYQKPLKIVRGQGQYLYDETGRAYLDMVNNVCHVGHSHPKVTRAAYDQMSILNTNTRYLHDNIVAYAEQLTATLPDPLNVCFLVCTGSEANELALRMARTYTGQHDVLVVDHAYHGNTSALIDLSPYKFDGRGGSGAPDYVHRVMIPDDYRGPYKRGVVDIGGQYARHVQETIMDVQASGKGVAAFFCESILGCGGQVVLPDDYLRQAYGYVRAAGGLCVADEVQVGFGRVGSHFWAFELQGVIPDIVTMGKPIGNGHPLAAVVTTSEIADAFNNGMEYFNTFGGNPVSCAVGQAVLEVIAEEKLQENALRVGAKLKADLAGLQAKYPLIGDVRGEGLFIGVELVLDRESLAPAAQQATYLIERLKDHGILLSTDGPYHNVIKMKPPIVLTEANADFLVRTMDKALTEDALQA